jgi:S1-C subfamily serine protease
MKVFRRWLGGGRGMAAVGLMLCLALGMGLVQAARAQAPAGPIPAELSENNLALRRASDAVVGVSTVAVQGAVSAASLGPVREGSGVVIGDDGLVLTIGYLILEADQVFLLTDEGRRIPARVLGYDTATGFGLVKALVPLGLQAAPMGDPSATTLDDTLLVISGGADAGISMAKQVSQRAFSGYWEYHLDHALFTAPARANHSGAALFNLRGELLGIGSLFVGDALGPGQPALQGNMFVPIDLLRPILQELVRDGRSVQSRRAWMGVNCIELEGEVRVLRLSPASPAEAAGIQVGDRIVRIDGVEVDTLRTLWLRLWAGKAEREVALDIVRDGRAMRVPLQTVDRHSTLKQPEGT